MATNNEDNMSLFPEEAEAMLQEPVTCLGMTFQNDEMRQEYFLDKLREKLKDPEFRKIKGFPIGKDEDILALSDPPYYTACPNPFIVDFIKHYGKPYDPATDNYHREPFASDVSEGKNDPIYNAHSYHTKVPHKAIMRYILHYTEPGDVVFDGFCGTGMTGVAAQLCGDKAIIESLDYLVGKDGTIYQQETVENGKMDWMPFSMFGPRLAFLNDLSPAATFIAYNYNSPVDVKSFESKAKRILKEVEDECGWMYETRHSDGRVGIINYTVWSDVFVCPECTDEVVFWEAAVDKETGRVSKKFSCPDCNASLTKRHMDRAWVTKFDKASNQTIRQTKQIPVLINYSVNKKRYEKRLDNEDLALIETIEQSDFSYWLPTNRLFEGGETRRNDIIGITHVHHLYTRRSIWILAALRERFKDWPQTMLLFTSQLVNVSRLNRYRPGVSFPYNPLSGTLYIGSQISEPNIFVAYSNKLRRFVAAYEQLRSRNVIECHSTTRMIMANASCDYVFTDPPFGGNLAYAELNVLWEEWLQVVTQRNQEAIESKHQDKSLLQYQALMTDCFKEYYRVLKPGRWMTVEFHNSKNSVWNSIQEALQHAGLVIADVRTLDKQAGTFKQVTSGGAVKQDLIISAYKPNGGLEDRFKLAAGTEEGVWDFIRTHMRQLPVFNSNNGQGEVIAERQNYLLFDRMVAFHVQRGVMVPLSASEFYAGLEQRFPSRDSMYFLPDQAAEYDKKRMTVKEVLQLQLFVSDEASAIQWLKQQLTKKPQTFQDIHPQFLREIGGWQKHEKILELSLLLRQNFLRYDGVGQVPSQIHSYLSSNFKELRNRVKDDPALRAKAKNRWYVPDPNKAGDLEQLRERALLKEFEEYCTSKQRRLKVFRLEAFRTGFKKAWQERDYATIIAAARKIPETILQEDPKLLMWYDQALTRNGEES